MKATEAALDTVEVIVATGLDERPSIDILPPLKGWDSLTAVGILWFTT